MLETFLIPLLKIAVLINALLVSVTFLVLMERKVMAWKQTTELEENIKGG